MNEAILIAEDNQAMSGVLKHKLESEGFLVTVAQDGKEALENVQKNEYKLILLDLTMPNVDGFQLLEEMRNANISVPTIVLSNLAQPEDRERALGLGAKKFFVKTEVTPASIIEEIKKMFSVV